MTAIDYLTKWIEARPINEATTEEIAKLTVKQIFGRHGCPRIIHTDRGTTFTSELFQEINKYMEIDHKVSTAYHPQSQGLVEKSHIAHITIHKGHSTTTYSICYELQYTRNYATKSILFTIWT